MSAIIYFNGLRERIISTVAHRRECVKQAIISLNAIAVRIGAPTSLTCILGHGLQFFEQQLEIMQSDEDAALSDHALAEVRRKLANIARGIAAAELAAQDVTHSEAERPSARLGLREGQK